MRKRQIRMCTDAACRLPRLLRGRGGRGALCSRCFIMCIFKNRSQAQICTDSIRQYYTTYYPHGKTQTKKNKAPVLCAPRPPGLTVQALLKTVCLLCTTASADRRFFCSRNLAQCREHCETIMTWAMSKSVKKDKNLPVSSEKPGGPDYLQICNLQVCNLQVCKSQSCIS